MDPATAKPPSKPELAANDLIRIEFVQFGIHKIPVVCDPLMADDELVFILSGKDGIKKTRISAMELWKNATLIKEKDHA